MLSAVWECVRMESTCVDRKENSNCRVLMAFRDGGHTLGERVTGGEVTHSEMFYYLILCSTYRDARLPFCIPLGMSELYHGVFLKEHML